MQSALRKLVCGLAAVLLCISAATAQDERFDIDRFQVEGNTLLPDALVQSLVSPFTGKQRVYGDLQKALEALEAAYRSRGYSTVQVFVPEQELTTGVVKLQVTEGVVGKIIVTGNKYFSLGNVLAALPALKEGKAPNLREMSENIQLSNENPAKQVEVTLGVSEADEGKVDAKVAVTDEKPQRAYMTLDSTGTAATGTSRAGVAYQHGNLFDRDHTLTLAYTGSLDSPGGVKVDIFSAGYRVPMYGIGDSMDFIFAKSTVNTPASTPVLGGALGIVGKGDVFGMRWNHHFPRRGEYTDKLVFGFDYKYINARCSRGVPPQVQPQDINPPTPAIASCVPYTSRPLSVTYSGTRQRPGEAMDYNLGYAQNWALGTKYTNTDGAVDRYSYLTPGNRPTRDSFGALRAGGSYLKAFQNDVQIRFAANGQYARNPMVSAEQFGFAGSTTVRGFTERAAATDSGFFFNNEVYTPELAKKLNWVGSLRLLAFYDFGRGYNNNTVAGGTTVKSIGIASAGIGARYQRNKDFSIRFDLAQVVDAGPANTKNHGDWRGHFNMLFAFW